jgi:hypothetical protein
VQEVFAANGTAGCALRPWQTTFSTASFPRRALLYRSKKKKHVCADFRGLLFGRAASALVFSEGFLQAEEKEKVSKQKQYAYSPCFGGLSV